MFAYYFTNLFQFDVHHNIFYSKTNKMNNISNLFCNSIWFSKIKQIWDIVHFVGFTIETISICEVIQHQMGHKYGVKSRKTCSYQRTLRGGLSNWCKTSITMFKRSYGYLWFSTSATCAVKITFLVLAKPIKVLIVLFSSFCPHCPFPRTKCLSSSGWFRSTSDGR
jgi:hypothetical protein